ncbi:MAG: hypothetical protein ABI274_10115 [Ktedonobacterales bacterium]
MSFFSTLSNIILVIATILALPGGLFMAWLFGATRARWASLLGGLIGAIVTAVAIYLYAQAAKLILDAIGLSIGAFLAVTIGVAVGALLANFLVGLASRRPDVSSFEF